MDKPKETNGQELSSDLLKAARTLGKHHAGQHFANHLSAADETLPSALARAEKEIEGYAKSGAEAKQAASHLRSTFREEWDRLYAHAISGLSLYLAVALSCLISFTSVAHADVMRLEGRALIVCESVNSVVRLQKVTEATGALPQRVDGCWKVSPPAEVIVVDKIGGLASIVYRKPGFDWTNGPALTPQTWLDGTGVTFAP